MVEALPPGPRETILSRKGKNPARAPVATFSLSFGTIWKIYRYHQKKSLFLKDFLVVYFSREEEYKGSKIKQNYRKFIIIFFFSKENGEKSNLIRL